MHLRKCIFHRNLHPGRCKRGAQPLVLRSLLRLKKTNFCIFFIDFLEQSKELAYICTLESAYFIEICTLEGAFIARYAP